VRARILGATATATATAAAADAPTTTPAPLPATALYITGGGSQALAWLLATPGASRLVVDAAVPYSREATADLLLHSGGGGVASPSPLSSSIDTVTSVTSPTAARLADAAYRRAAQLTPPGRPCVGIGATSALASEPPKRGAHRAHVAARWGAGATATATLELAKGARTRWQEDGVAARLVLRVLARAVHEAAAAAAGGGAGDAEAVAEELDLGLVGSPAQQPHDVLTEKVVLHPFADFVDDTGATTPTTATPTERDRRAALAALLAGKARCVEFSRDGRVCAVDAPRGGGANVSGASPPVVYLSGSFNPLHAGHEGLLLAARRAAEAAALGSGGGGATATTATTTEPLVPGAFELSIGNADKGQLPLEEAERRAAQFARAGLPLLVTAGVPLFTQKSALLPGAWFAVGYDTAVRLVQSRYYDSGEDGDGGALEMALQFERLRAAGCRFLVAGRAEGAASAETPRRFLTLADVPMPRGLADLFVDIPESAFRNDVSSTELRAKGQGLV
jgi:hypothetical protein